MGIPDPLSVAPLRPLKVVEYRQMIDAGIFREDERVELLRGVLVAKSPQGYLHGALVQRLNTLLVRGVGDAFDVRPQLGLTLTEDSEPEPDFAVVPAGMAGDRKGHPAHALLAVEVAVSSLRLDRTVKAALYATANIPEYWIVIPKKRSIEVYREPDVGSARYVSVVTYEGEHLLTPVALPGPRLTPAQLFADLEG